MCMLHMRGEIWTLDPHVQGYPGAGRLYLPYRDAQIRRPEAAIETEIKLPDKRCPRLVSPDDT